MAAHLMVLMLACVVIGVNGNTFRMGACPRVTVMRELDFDQFTGEWYVIQRFNPMATCTKLVIEKTENGDYTVNETARPLGIHFTYHNQYMPARKIKFLRNDTQSIFRIEKSFTHMTLGTFGIVDTDYSRYAVVWGCDPALFGSIQNVDVLSRTRSPDETILKETKDILKDLSVDTLPLENVEQSHCGDESADESESPYEKNTNNMVTG